MIHVQTVHLARVDLRQRARQEIGLLLVCAFEDDAVAGRDQGFQKGDDVARRDDTGRSAMVAARAGAWPCRRAECSTGAAGYRSASALQFGGWIRK